jgi:thioredoxin-dependent peroxiredoxin
MAKRSASKAKAKAKTARGASRPKSSNKKPSRAAAKKKSRATKTKRITSAARTARAKVAPAKPARAAAAKAKSAKAKSPKPKNATKPKPLAKATAASANVAEGSHAPAFQLADEGGQLVHSQGLSGNPYVLYFYPKDDTPGCTTEACGFRDSLNRFAQRGVKIVGVSPDSSQSHAKFKEKYGLNFSLLSDPEKSLAKSYGVWVMKSNYGREYMGIERSTFLVDAQGVVKKSWRGVRVPGHVDAVLSELENLA